ncbi:tRNA pseudouridine(38-40) synthase TruA [Rubripirellula reticaptiva]|uniref:tRNA pseudouridine synthase A n=1 Tax=Rubripirellula reticaptiva TaxID=2528013 RepID=A0A5C6F9R3_9BACT|nr:tRNA pseudouridine(38-40) synthase TruA [Rubripirellula reticaptiva]TWU57290.1 tRNA pseudouridine synthase A [Rubripirellula reticaptiva]
MPGTFKLTVAYDGTDFAGWQVQTNTNKRTIQGAMQRAVRKVTGQDAIVMGSGRTDAGVHALAQVACVRIPNWRHPAKTLIRAINVRLPDTVSVLDAVEAPDDFHPIRDAIGKRYRYQLQIGGMRDAFDHRYRWHHHAQLDLDAMRDAAARIVGKADFASFQGAGSVRKTTTRDVRACDIIIQPTTTDQRAHIAIEVEADGFLYNMVRNIVGSLVSVGLGQHAPSWIDQVIAAKDRRQAAQTAPAHGLFMIRVDYPTDNDL